MMNKDEAVLKLARQALISTAHAEDLYDSFFEKPVVPQYVADWYEANKQNLNLNLCGFVSGRAINSTNCYREDFTEWVNDNKKTFITTLVNMHQFGYEVEKEKRYTVTIKAVLGQYLGRYYLNDEELTPQFTKTQFTGDKGRPTFTRKELEDAGFGWVFSCEGVEVKEATDE